MPTTLLMRVLLRVQRSQKLLQNIAQGGRRRVQNLLRGQRWLRSWGLGAIAVFSLASLALASPDGALKLNVTPNSPQLGDTLTVMVESSGDAAPTLSMGGKTYQTFAQGDRFRALLPTTPLNKPGKLDILATRAEASARATVSLRNRSFPTQSIWLPPGKDGNIDDREYDIVDAFKQRVTPQKLWSGAFRRPNSGPTTTGYGVRRYYNGEFAQDYFHRGVDYAGNYGSPVLAAAAGEVALIGRESQGFRVHGNTIGLDHGQGVETIYIHLSRIDVKAGDRVKAGQVIGAVGSTGSATGPHLHWGLYVNGQCVDPVPWRERGFE
jgi:murein DD-endopeptidase MepM/ murein hydrolase activator NlpD